MKIRPEIRPEMHGIFATRTTLYKNTLKLSYIYVNSPPPPSPQKKANKVIYENLFTTINSAIYSRGIVKCINLYCFVSIFAVWNWYGTVNLNDYLPSISPMVGS